MRVNCLAEEHSENAVPRPGLNPGSLDQETSVLTLRPPHLKHRSKAGDIGSDDELLVKAFYKKN